MGLFKRSAEAQIKHDIYARARAMADQAYQKDVMFRNLQASDLNYAIIKDLMQSAALVGKVTIKMHDLQGKPTAEIVIESTGQRAELNRLDEQQFYDQLPKQQFNGSLN